MPKIRIYTTPTCPYCTALKNFLKEHNIEFEEVDVSVDDQARKEMIQKTNQLGVPVVEIGDEFVVGFEKEKISKLLNIR